ncbi:hypothetical protein GCM10008096_03830 [Zhihengliuella salsuginis]|uniref:Uncharacterized protein n=1 Tax=Zhihengliuella salsuginis TaxID=578222 RepID=A0ABQ3GBJ8_9MICC|nr:hypothetical protein GCM10008096_03830 [Zhihengliuella salsuginis]
MKSNPCTGVIINSAATAAASPTAVHGPAAVRNHATIRPIKIPPAVRSSAQRHYATSGAIDYSGS